MGIEPKKLTVKLNAKNPSQLKSQLACSKFFKRLTACHQCHDFLRIA